VRLVFGGGFTYWGPFDNVVQAMDYIEAELDPDESWEIIPLITPDFAKKLLN